MDKPVILCVGGPVIENYVSFANMQQRFAFRYSRDFEIKTFEDRFKPVPVGLVIDVGEYWPLAKNQGYFSRREAVDDFKFKIRKFWPDIQFYFLSVLDQDEEQGVFLLGPPGTISPKDLHSRIDQSFATE